ncbi:MAG: glycosyltransferase [Paludibacteraceae bacterium]|nr:glycosyltransferase [Paludibacteraceae bacterium]
MKPRVLILTDPFGPPAYNPRLRSLCDHLTAQGWPIDVYTESCPSDFEHTYPIHLIPIYRTKSVLEWAVKSVCSLLFDWRNRFFSRQVRKATEGQIYDLILCTTFSTFPLRAAMDIARERQIPLHVDLRDIDEQVPGAQYQSHRQWWLRPFRNWYRNINIRRRNKVLSKADSITTVSPWHVDFLKPINKNIFLLYNGFDSKLFFPKDQPAKSFSIAYVGRLYEQHMQDPTLLFEALQTLDIDFKVRWYTNPAGQKRLRLLAQQYGVERFMEYHDYVPLSQVPDILHDASILLVLSNNAQTSGAHGIMTTKFFEALGVEKPVLCVRSDEECLAQVIHETNAGLAATNKDEVRVFILDKYREWQTKGFTRQPVRDTNRFTRQYQAQEFEELLRSALNIQQQTYIIIPAYNAGNYLAECLCSVKNQTFENWRCIVVDDASTDHTAQIAQAFVDADDRFTLLRHYTNRGQSAARNTALDYLSTLDAQLVAFVDADDWLDKDYLQTLVSHIGNKDIVQVGYRRVSDEGSVSEFKLPNNPYQFTVPWGKLYRAEWLQDLRFPEGMIYEDVIFSLKLWAKHPKQTIIPYIGYNYRLNPASTTARIDQPAQRKLYATIRGTKAPCLLKLYTILRLKLHFWK